MSIIQTLAQNAPKASLAALSWAAWLQMQLDTNQPQANYPHGWQAFKKLADRG